jgi:hypothetical protein
MDNGRSNDWRPDYFPFAGADPLAAPDAGDAPDPLAAADAGDAPALPDEAGPAFFLGGFAGRLLPNEPLNIFPFLVFLSPLPIK